MVNFKIRFLSTKFSFRDPVLPLKMLNTLADVVDSTKLISRHCTDTLLRNADFFDGPCLKHAVSKGLSCGIIAGSAILKVPQIRLIVKSGTVKGLSPSSFYLEAAACT